ncbi:hypothetical protein TWF569_009915 [Orbilia oligospora]|nr:hypothetical protein TWF569_009915 [Orbilia oligospora]
MHLSTLLCGLTLMLPLASCAVLPLGKRTHDSGSPIRIRPLNHTEIYLYPWPRIAVNPGPQKRHHEKTRVPTKDAPHGTWSLPSVSKRDHESQAANSIGTEAYRSNHVDIDKRAPEPHSHYSAQEVAHPEVYHKDLTLNLIEKNSD